MSGIFGGLFGGANPGRAGATSQQAAPAAPAAQQAAPAPAAVQTPAGDPNANPAATNPTDPNAVNPATGVVDPFAQIQNPWSNPTQDANAPKQFAANAVVNFDQQAVQQAVQKMDFVGQIPQQITDLIASGDPAKVQQGIAAIVNNVGRTVYMQVAASMSGLVNNAFGSYDTNSKASIADMIRQNSASAGLMDTHPILSNPAVKPMADALISQYTKNNPGKTPSQIQQMAVDYIKSMSAAVTGTAASEAAVSPTAQAPASVDWAGWMGGN